MKENPEKGMSEKSSGKYVSVVEITPLGILSVFILGICVGISLMYLYAQNRYDNPGWQTKRDQQVQRP